MRKTIVKSEKWEFFIAFIAVIFIILAGSFGYMLIEDWSFFDSLYMTVITISTVGYREVHSLSDAGRAYTIVLLIVGIATVFGIFITVVTNLIQKQLKRILKREGMQDKINKLEGHTILCGYGRLAKVAARELRDRGLTLVVIEQDPEIVSESADDGFLLVKGDATEEEVLELAGVKTASKLVSLLPKDSDNLYVVLTARELNKEIYILSRAEDENGEKRLRQAGADKITAPYSLGGHNIAQGLLRPYVENFIDLATTSKGIDIQLEQLKVNKNSPISGLSLKEAQIRQKTNINIAAVILPDGRTEYNPSSNTKIEPGSILIGIGQSSDFELLDKILKNS